MRPRPIPASFKAVGVTGVFALERRDEVLAVVAVRAAVQHRLEDPETGLAPEIQIADDGSAVPELQVGRFFVVAAVAAAAVGQRPGDFKAVAVAVPLKTPTFSHSEKHARNKDDYSQNTSEHMVTYRCLGTAFAYVKVTRAVD
jgi:hypothetical protein